MNNLFRYDAFTKSNTKSSRFCNTCNCGFTTESKFKVHVCAKNIKRNNGRYVCNSCDFESYDIDGLWDHVDKVKHNGIWSACGIKRSVMTLFNSPRDCICAKCGKGFTNPVSADKHFADCSKRPLMRIIKTIKYCCKTCGHASLMKTTAQRHFRKCNSQLLGGSGLLINRLNVQKKLVKLDLAKYNEKLISKQIFTNTVKIFQKDKTTSIKALCTFHTIAERLTPGASEVEKKDIYFTTNTEQVFELNYQQTTQKWAQQLAVDIDEWVENGSGFAITNIVSAHCTFVTYKDDFGGSGADIPDKFYKCGRLIRVINTPVGSQECFKLCLSIIRNGATEIPKQTTALRKLSGIIVDYNDLAVDQELEDCIKTYDESFVLSNIPKISVIRFADFNLNRIFKTGTFSSILKPVPKALANIA